MQQTPPPLFDSEQFVRQTSALKDALQSLSKTTKKPSFLMLEPNFVPNDWDAENVPLSVLELLGDSINAIQEETSRWKSKYFTKAGTGFHSIDFQNRGAGKRYIIAVQNELSMQICSSKHLIMQKCLTGIRFFLIIHLSIYVPHIQMSKSPYPNPFLTQHSDTATTKSVKYPTSIYLYFSHLAPKLAHPDVPLACHPDTSTSKCL